MNWRNLWNRLRGAPRSLETDLDEEIAFHRAMKERELRAAGLGASEASSAAARSIGNLTLAREQAREAWSFVWLADLARDLRYGFRSIASEPGFTLAAVVALTVGIGVNAVVFNVFNALALTPWAVRDPGNVVSIHAERGRGRWGGFSRPEYRFLRDNSRLLRDLVALDGSRVGIRQGDSGWQARGIGASENFFDALGTGFAFGRGFSAPADPIRNPEPEVVLAYAAWRARFGGDPGVVGQWLDINGHRLQVVGVAAEGFAGPVPESPDLWFPLAWRDRFEHTRAMEARGSCCVQVHGRLAPGTGRAAAQEELTALSSQFRKSPRGAPARVLLGRASFLANPRAMSQAAVIFGPLAFATLLILLLACANVANLLLARAQKRRREIAVRLSIGASRSRVLRQLLTEALILSAAASFLSLLAANWLPGALVRWIASEDGVSMRFAADWRVAAFVFAASLATTAMFALAPAWSAVRGGAVSGLSDASARTTSGNRLRFALLSAQVALCATLLSGASLLLRAVQQVRNVNPGFRYEDVIVLAPNLDSAGLSDRQAIEPIDRLREKIAGMAGVRSVAYAAVTPLGNTFRGTVMEDPRTRENFDAGVAPVSAGFFETLGIPMLAGRTFTAADESAPGAIIVNQPFAARMWPGEQALGKAFRFAGQNVEVVGIVGEVRVRDLSPADLPYVYQPSRGTRDSRLLVRYSGSPNLLLSELPKLARSVEPRSFASAVPYGDLVDRARRVAGMSAAIASALSAIALGLAFIGIYAVASYHVAQRAREIGVRIALGAQPAQILRLVGWQNLRPVLLGSVFGIGGAAAMGRLLTSLLYGVSPSDHRALAMTIAILAATAAFATWSPARRAAAVDPSITLRHD